jgi:hypothetical protein
MGVLRYSPHRLIGLAASTFLMTTTPPPSSDVYLLRRRPMLTVFWGLPYVGLLRGGPPPIARLELTDEAVRCTIVDKSGYAKWLARRLGMKDLKKRLKTSQPVTVFEFPRGDYDIDWPDTSLGTVCEIRHGATDSWVISFLLPADYEDFDVLRYFHTFRAYQTRAARREWRKALDPGQAPVRLTKHPGIGAPPSAKG